MVNPNLTFHFVVYDRIAGVCFSSSPPSSSCNSSDCCLNGTHKTIQGFALSTPQEAYNNLLTVFSSYAGYHRTPKPSSWLSSCGASQSSPVANSTISSFTMAGFTNITDMNGVWLRDGEDSQGVAKFTRTMNSGKIMTLRLSNPEFPKWPCYGPCWQITEYTSGLDPLAYSSPLLTVLAETWDPCGPLTQWVENDWPQGNMYYPWSYHLAGQLTNCGGNP